MTKKLQTLINQDTDLDLSNETVAKMVAAANVDNQPTTATDKPAPKAKPGKRTTFSMTLSTEELAGVIRSAGATNISWQDWLKSQIQEHILTGKIGRAVISQPSTMTDKVSGFKGGIVSRG